MDFLIEFLNRITGPETELVELLPLAVLGVLVVAIHYLRNLILKLFIEIGEVKNLINIRQLMEDIKKESGGQDGH